MVLFPLLLRILAVLLCCCFVVVALRPLHWSSTTLKKQRLRRPQCLPQRQDVTSSLARHLFQPPKRTLTTMYSEPISSSSSFGSTSASINSKGSNQLHRIFYFLNANTKWYVTVVNTMGIWLRVPHYEGPWIVVGAIASAFLADVLKQIMNHSRPAGSPFTDPGMPSSHSLVCFFMAAAWTTLLDPSLWITGNCHSLWIGRGFAWTSAATIALLRVVCGYHSWNQIGVGAALGVIMGWVWATTGQIIYQVQPQFTTILAWVLYLAGSALFMVKKMKTWLGEHKHL